MWRSMKGETEMKATGMEWKAVREMRAESMNMNMQDETMDWKRSATWREDAIVWMEEDHDIDRSK